MTEGPNLSGLLETARRLQEQVARLRDELAAKRVEGETGGGLVRCVASGRGEVLSLSIDPSVVREGNQTMIADLVVGAVNLALDHARELAEQEMARATGGLPLPPGLFGG